MSRGVRDLRDLICVSRLTVRDSDEEIFSDDEVVIKDLDTLSVSSASSVDSSKRLPSVERHVSPDSGCVTNTCSSTPPETAVETDVIPKKTKPKKRKKRDKKPVLNIVPGTYELPRAEVLPPVASTSFGSIISENQDVDEVSSPVVDKRVRANTTNFDDMMCYIDATVVSSWLSRANDNVQKLCEFCQNSEKFVQFAHFWLSDFPDQQKNEIFELEYEIIVEEANFAFTVGKEQRKITNRDILGLITAVFREYPGILLSSKGPYLFLDYLDVLSSEKQTSYKRLLSDVKCSTRNKQYAQWILAMRSFTLLSVWTAIVNFYRNLKRDVSPTQDHSLLSSSSKESVHHQRVVQAIRLGLVDVLHYYITTALVNPHYKDSHNRTYIFTAVMYNQPSILHYLINRVKPPIDVNCAADTGNTPLHAAANNGNVDLVTILLQNPRIDINYKNPQCEEATPLHLAIMLGNREVVEKLLKMGANAKLTMGDLTAEDIARDFGHAELLPLLKS
ncbi:uncharacterized protein LOC134281575 [Saccostrea cucullata]|uniref:uncharacterized protein LOC134281575 n=1 Tax=Saccostrea cuccullata TaxID=36930 RepID=UPI002ED134C1